MKALGALVFCLFAAMTARAGSFDQEHAAWTGVLQKYQTDAGLVRYKQLKADAAAKAHPFNGYLESLAKLTRAEFDGFAKNDKIAFLINAYNAYTVKLIVDNYPVESIKKIGGLFTKPWDVEFFSLLGGQITSLDPIEHKMLRPNYRDYRVHAAVNCASISCPPLRHEAFVGARLDAQLDEQMRLWLADPSRNKFDAQTGELSLSRIFDWYAKDFEEWGGGVKAVVSKFGPEAARQAYAKKGEVDFLDYDWGLNEAK
jgi:hypothetical protein